MKKLMLLLFTCFLCSFVKANPEADPSPTTSCFMFPSIVGSKILFNGCPNSEEIGNLQICGYELGYNSDPLPGNHPNIDNKFRWRTKNLVKRIQEAAGLHVTGIFDAATARALEGMCCGISAETLTKKYGIRGSRLNRIMKFVGDKVPEAGNVYGDRITSIEQKLSRVVDKQNFVIDSLKSMIDSLENDQMFKKVNEDNRKERDLMEALVNKMALMSRQIQDLTILVKKNGFITDTINSIDTMKKTHLIAYNVGGELYSQVRGSDKTYRPTDNALNVGISVTPFKSKHDAITMNATLGSNFMYERFVDQKAFTGTVGYRKQFLNPSSSFEIRAGYFTRMGEAGTILVSTYEGKPFMKKNDVDGMKFDISGVTVGASALFRFAKTEWVQVVQVKAMYPLWDDNARIGVHYLGHREEGLMKKGGFLSDVCHVVSARFELNPRIKTFNSQYTYQPKLFIQYGSDIGKIGKYNVFSIGADFSRIVSQFHNRKIAPHQTQISSYNF